MSEKLLTLPFRDEAHGASRDLAILLLDRRLRRLECIRNPADLRLGCLLSRLEGMSGCLALGFARLADYAAERLRIPTRRARAVVTLAGGIEQLPGLAAAFDAG